MPRMVAVNDEQYGMDPDHADEIIWMLQHPEDESWSGEVPQLFAAGQLGFRVTAVGSERWGRLLLSTPGRRSLADGDPLTGRR